MSWSGGASFIALLRDGVGSAEHVPGDVLPERSSVGEAPILSEVFSIEGGDEVVEDRRMPIPFETSVGC